VVPGVYRDRTEAGETLAGLLAAYAHRHDVTVLALPRGGVPVAHPVARALDAPLDILAVRKLGVPGHEELAMGAIAAGGVRVVNADVVTHLAISDATMAVVTEMEQVRLAEQEARFRRDRPPAPRGGRHLVLVDDGLATGATMEAAILSCRQAGASAVVVAVPVGPPATVAHMATLADVVVCPMQPARFVAVGSAYRDFSPVDDDEVVSLLDSGAPRRW
jgi:predicted phosphoribosyltransferase